MYILNKKVCMCLRGFTAVQWPLKKNIEEESNYKNEGNECEMFCYTSKVVFF